MSAHHVALAVGSRAVVQMHSGDVVADIETGEAVTSNLNMQPLALRPSGEHVAVVLRILVVAVAMLKLQVHLLKLLLEVVVVVAEPAPAKHKLI